MHDIYAPVYHTQLEVKPTWSLDGKECLSCFSEYYLNELSKWFSLEKIASNPQYLCTITYGELVLNK
jgi:hypothetical protein